MLLLCGSVTGRALDCVVEVKVLAWIWEMEAPACFRLPMRLFMQLLKCDT